MDTPRIPLLLFPLRVQKLVFGNMNEVYQLAISLLSVKTRKLIKSLKIYSDLPTISIGDTIRISFNFYFNFFYLNFYEGQDLQPDMPLPPSNKLSFRFYDDDGGRSVVWTFEKGLTVKQWLDHFMDVLNTPRLKELSFCPGAQRFCPEAVKEIAGDYKTLIIDSFLSDEEKLKIANNFLGESNLQLDNIRNSKMHQILIRHIGKLKSISMKLNDLLVCNSSIILSMTNIPDKHLNTFLKLWIHGANPRLQKLDLKWPFSLYGNHVLVRNPNVILKGIQTVPVFNEHKAKLPSHPYSQLPIQLQLPLQLPLEQTEVDIKRDDGTWATLVVTNHMPSCADVLFMVWD